MLANVGDVGNPAWRLVVMRPSLWSSLMLLFFTAINFEKDRVARGILLSCLPSVLGYSSIHLRNESIDNGEPGDLQASACGCLQDAFQK